MNQSRIEFVLSNVEKIIIDLGIPLEELDCCYREPIVFVKQHKKVILSNDTIDTDMKYLKKSLEKCLNNQLLLHESIKNDIGYLYNEYYQDKSRFLIGNIDGINTWIGYRYQLWQAYKNRKRFATWLYNDEINSIVFEVSPCYPYLFSEPEQEPHYVSYSEWIKDYKPYIVRKVSKEIAQQWLEQASSIVQQINENIARWTEEESSLAK